MKKITAGLLLGLAAGIIDMIPMIFQGLIWDANLSAFSLWIVAGFLIATSNLKVKGALKGVIISFMVLLPSAILIGWQDTFSLIPITLMTLLLGSALGYLIEKFGK
jgi:uncharacterized membrane protein AbrB (regulator of aidB expression)